MNSNDLFSFLDEGVEDDEANDVSMEDVAAQSTSKAHQKRKANTPPMANSSDMQTVNGNEVDINTNGAGPSVPKKPRLSSPKPVILDDFETEAKREVAADAGLTGAADAGSRLELKHQVLVS